MEGGNEGRESEGRAKEGATEGARELGRAQIWIDIYFVPT